MVFAARPEDGLTLIRRALRLNPRPPVWYVTVEGDCHYLAGRFAAAIESYRKVLERVEQGVQARTARRWLIASYGELGREAKARAEARKYREQDPHFSLGAYANTMRREPYRDPAIVERHIGHLRKAGLPE